MESMGPGALFRAGRLDDAVAAAEHCLRASPGDAAARVLLAELLLFAGQFERADTVLVAAEAVEPGLALVVAEFRQLLRAASARREVFGEGRLPEFLGEPTPTQTCLLQTLVALRAADGDAARAAAEAAEACRPTTPGHSNGSPFADFRDADDLLGGNVEVLTTTGRYYWVPMQRVASMEFLPPKRPRDLVWRRCSLSVQDGPDGDVYVPALYEAAADSDAIRLGRTTEWTATAPVRGAGQRMFLVGDEGVPVTRLEMVEFARARECA